jgi:hypothetical protein
MWCWWIGRGGAGGRVEHPVSSTFKVWGVFHIYIVLKSALKSQGLSVAVGTPYFELCTLNLLRLSYIELAVVSISSSFG